MKTKVMRSQLYISAVLLISALTVKAQHRGFYIDKSFDLQPALFADNIQPNSQIVSLPMLSKIGSQTTHDLVIEQQIAGYNWRADHNRIDSIKNMAYRQNSQIDCLGRDIEPEMIEVVRTEVILKSNPGY